MGSPVTQILRRLVRKGVVVTSIAAGYLFLTQSANAYPSFIGYGYTSCIVCHYNAFGNGPLTDYGRALGATAISGKPFYNPNISDQDYGDQSGFLGGIALPDMLRLSADYRGLYNVAGFGMPGQETQKQWINMQAEGSIVGKFKDDTLIAVATIGYIPATGAGAKKVISREHYVSYAVKRNIRIYGGMQDVVYGIRTPDHTGFNREAAKISHNDQVHGVAAHFGFSAAEIGVHAFLGNLFQDSVVRQSGLSLLGEYDLAEKVRIGASAMFSTGKLRSRTAGAIHLRAGVGKGSSLLLETGVLSDNPKEAALKKNGAYIYSQTMTRLFRGFHFLFTGEFMSADAFRPSERRFRVGPSIQYFPLQRLELRVDLWGERSIGAVRDFERPDNFQLLSQVHLWF